ncbi:TPA: hypothetical protein H1005_01545 [archaeon]|uniref:Transcription factor CBF/NF-Y/archaeal histone domain-containing protein n=1 Tax=Candidatus Naiadarchaeum limnaeum TaxID=2756139 RepID=A0A832UZA3_9ARCH|nr:hypothetical protein [Candidatus Naiadarchaeales archaeon SRR2090153.bin1042]HIK00049.1 hypothetical protein [Candidatus Naiadarchaeum limnaeum]
MAQEQQEAIKKNQNGEEEIAPELEAKLPFPNAAVVRVMREVIDRDKIISKRVKIEMNKWLSEICKDVSRELNKNPYTKIEGDDFANAIQKYRLYESVDAQKHKVKKSLNRIIEDAQELINQVDNVKSD